MCPQHQRRRRERSLEEEAVVGDFSRLVTKCVKWKIPSKDAGNAVFGADVLLVRAIMPDQS
jgi:hypothetical protein